MKIYAVFRANDDEWSDDLDDLIAVTASKEKADSIVRDFEDEPWIEEYDDGVPTLTPSLTVRFDEIGNITQIVRGSCFGSDRSDVKVSAEFYSYREPSIRVKIPTRDRDLAVKVAREVYAKYMAKRSEESKPRDAEYITLNGYMSKRSEGGKSNVL